MSKELSEKVGNWEKYFEYSKETLANEEVRLNNLDEKATKFIGVTTILVALLGILFSTLFKSFIFTNSFFGYLSIGSLILGVSMLLSSIVFSLQALKLKETNRMPLDKQTDDLFFQSTMEDVYVKLIKSIQVSYNSFREVAELKVKKLEIAFNELLGSIFFIVSGLILLFIR
ncbi:hypothetical protein [Pseudoalteromonas sp. M58]|uniref:hypothetical protein n=1 Tax=Pseudoalteromonas sp. M58 TaxID=3141534 RepID=UPI00366AE635